MNAEERPALPDEGGGAEEQKPWLERGSNGFIALLGVLIVGLAVWYSVASSGGDGGWSACDDAVSARLPGPLDYDATAITWRDVDEHTRTADGTVHTSDGATYRFQCGVTDGELDWLDLTPAR